MINLLPLEVREQRKFGRLNHYLQKQLIGLAIIGIAAVGFMLSGLQFIKADERLLIESIAIKETAYQPLKEYEEQAKELNDSVGTIQKLFDKELKFSELLVKIAQSIPDEARLTAISLSEGLEDPLTMTIVVKTQAGAGVVRKTLVDSGTFSTADILNISDGEQNDAGEILNYNVTIKSQLANESKKSDPVVEPTEPEGEK